MKVMWLCGVALGACTTGAQGEAVQALDTDAGVPMSDAGSGEPGGSLVFHSTLNGSSAGAGLHDGVNNGMLTVYENATAQNRLAFLQFYFDGPDLTTESCWLDYDWWTGQEYTRCEYTHRIVRFGAGMIPSADFTVAQAAAGARLQTTTGPSFYVETCRFPTWAPWEGTCTYGGNETFDLRWTSGNFGWEKRTGTTERRMGPFTTRESGTLTSSSAMVEGTAFGRTFANNPGHMQRSVGAAVQRSVYKVMP